MQKTDDRQVVCFLLKLKFRTASDTEFRHPFTVYRLPFTVYRNSRPLEIKILTHGQRSHG